MLISTIRAVALNAIFLAVCSAASYTLSLGSVSWESGVNGGIDSGNFAVQVLSNHHDLAGEVQDYVELTDVTLKVKYANSTEELVDLVLGTSPATVGAAVSVLQPQTNYSVTQLNYYTRNFYDTDPALVVGATLEFKVNHPSSGPWQLVNGSSFFPDKPDWTVILNKPSGATTLPYNGQKVIESLAITGTVPEPADVSLVLTGLVFFASLGIARHYARCN